MQQANMEKEKGNQLFKDGKYEAAIGRYTTACTLDSTNPIYYANRAMALIKMEKYGAAEQDCTTAVQYDSTYTKAYARRATARHRLKRFAEARADYVKVLELEPKNKQAPSELLKLDKDEKKMKETNKVEKIQAVQDKESNGERSPKRKRRSNKPLKRLHIQEIGVDENDNLSTSRNEEELGQSSRRLINKQVPKIPLDTTVLVPSPTDIPTTSFNFESEFKRLRTNETELYKYLKVIPTGRYNKLFHQCIDSVMSPFINLLYNCYKQDAASYDKELIALSDVPRFGMAIMFLSNKDKQVLIKLFKHMNSPEYPGNLSPALITSIAGKYGIKL